VYEEHREGEVTFLRPPLPKVPTTSMPVFYNPKSELNRDTTIIALKAFLQRYGKTEVRVCTPLAGTGVRALRIAKEVSGIKKVVAGDVNPTAIELIEKNRKMNGLIKKIEIHQSGANRLLTQYSSFHQRFDVIDIDPFGSPREFFASAIGALKPHGLLCLTATDMPVLVGIRQEACIKRYAAVPQKTEYAHELALRILLGCVVREAASQNMGLEPLLSFSIDHYVRLYCEALEGDDNTWTAVSQLGYLGHCKSCGFRSVTYGLASSYSPCPQCQTEAMQQAGPLWVGRFAEKGFIEEVIQQADNHTIGTKRRTLSLLRRLRDEVEGPPTYYNLHNLTDRLNIPVPSFRTIIDELRGANEFCSRTHFSPHAIRTSATEEHLTKLLLKLTKEI
jgi:tRNA (guanine26-N2/guanine27-N2)-dimethyltransferase